MRRFGLHHTAGIPRLVTLWLLLGSATVATPGLLADPVFYIDRGDTWKFFRGINSAPSADGESWKLAGFDESAFANGNAPFGYDDGPFGTDLEALNPPMEDNYSSLYLRRTFSVSDASQLVSLEVNVDYDDGFILWINGVEVLRRNVSGTPDFDGFADSNHESGTYENYDLPDPVNYLVDGDNVVAAIVLNNQISSSDLKFDLDLNDPLGPDLTAPRVAALTPGADTVVRSLARIEVTFDEDVTGVDASDLRIDGAPASTVSGEAAGPYVFTFADLSPGVHTFSWIASPGIVDLSPAANAFVPPPGWEITVDPDAPLAQIVINELLAANSSGLRDEDGERSDWFEIVNVGAEVADITGFSVSDDPDAPSKCILPSRTLAPGEHLVIFASGKDRRPPGSGEIHTPFKLSSTGEFLALYNNASPRVAISAFDPRFPEQRRDISYGREPGGGLGYFDPPTPGQANGASLGIEGLVEEPVASAPRGFYVDPFSVELTTATPGATIRYTLDGSEPAANRGTVYSGPINVQGTSTRAVVMIKAAAFRSNYLPSHSVSYTYIFPEHVKTQPNSPSGFPSSWGGAPSVDYEMDPQVVNDPAYRDVILPALLQIPTVSIVMDVDDMFGSSGIYSNPGGDGVSWERPTSAELMYPDGGDGFQVNCGIRIHGGASRNPGKSPKHSVRLLFKGAYGPTKLNFPVFDNSPVEEFDTLIFRANYNNSWIHWDSGQRSRGQMVRDQWVRDAQLAASGLSSHGTYVNLYINGLYWGVFNLVERPSAPFAASHLGGEKEEYDALNSGSAVDGNTQAWNTLLSRANGNVSTLSGLQAVAEYLDLNHFIDYMLINFYGANADWPSHNWYAVRRRVPGAPWYFISWDAERIFEGVTSNRLGANNGNSPGEIFQNLRANAEFRLMVADRAHRHLFNGGVMTPGGASAIWNARADQISLAVVGESARWGDYRRDVHSSSNGPYEFYRRDSHYLPEKNRLLTTYFPRRDTEFLQDLRSANLYPSVGAPIFNQHGGRIEPGFELNMSRPGGTTGTIYYTLDGEDPREFGTGDTSDSALTYTGAVTLSGFARVKARTRSGSTWSALNEATFFISADTSPLRISEIHYHPPTGSGAEFLEIHNSGATTLDLSGLRFSDGIRFEFPPGASIAAGEHIVLVASAAAFEATYPGVPFAGVYSGALDNGGETLRMVDGEGNLVLTIEYNDGDFWPLAPDGFGFSLVRRDAAGDPADPGSWRASAAAGGSPGEADPPAVSLGVTINEILTSASGAFENAVELYNGSPQAVDIGGWYLSDRRTDVAALRRYRIAPGTVLAPGGHATFYEQDLSTSAPPGTEIELNARGGALYLTAVDGSEALTGHIVGVDFGAAPDGVSLGRHETSAGPDLALLERPTFGVDNPIDVTHFRSGAGAPNSLPAVGEAVIHEIHYHPAPGLPEFIELRNLTDAPMELHNASLGRGWQIEGVFNLAGDNFYEFAPGTTIEPQGFLVVASVDPAFFRGVYDLDASVPVVGPYTGALDNGGERLRLQRPELIDGAGVEFIVVDAVRYDDDAPWDAAADGDGPSLERRFASEYGNDPENWQASLDADGTPGSENSITDSGANQRPFATFTFTPEASAGEYFFDASGSNDPDGEIVLFEWNFGDGATANGATVTHVFPGSGDFTVLLTVTDDDDASSTTTRRVTVEQAGGQIPGDGNQDGVLDMSDALTTLGYLFRQDPTTLPCDTPAGSRALFDVNDDAFVDIGDAVYTLFYLFRPGAPQPALGVDCVPIVGCPEVCTP